MLCVALAQTFRSHRPADVGLVRDSLLPQALGGEQRWEAEQAEAALASHSMLGAALSVAPGAAGEEGGAEEEAGAGPGEGWRSLLPSPNLLGAALSLMAGASGGEYTWDAGASPGEGRHSLPV